jgi:predicted Zn-dependent protease
MLGFGPNRRALARFAAIAALLALPVTGSAQTQVSPDALASFEKAKADADTGNWQAAKVHLLNVGKIAPNWREARVLQARAALMLDDGEMAEDALRIALDHGEKPGNVRHLLGHALFLRGKYEQAKKQLSAGDIPRGDLPYAARYLAKTAAALQDLPLADAAFAAAFKLDSKNPALWTDLGRYRLSLADQGGAIAAAERALKIDANFVPALLLRGETVRDQFGPIAAMPWLERALAEDNSNIAVLTQYAATLGDAGRATDMLAICRQILSRDNKNADAYYMQSVLAARAGRYKLAQSLMQRTSGRLDDVPAVILTQGVIAFGTGSYNLATERFRRLVAMQPDNRRARDLLARSLYLADDAKGVLETQPAIGMGSGYAAWVSARAMEQLGKRGDAAKWLDQAAVHGFGANPVLPGGSAIGQLRSEARRQPDNARAVIPYIRALVGTGQMGEAFSLAQRLQRRNPGVADAHILVADVAMAMRRWDIAIRALTDARALRYSEGVMLRLVESQRQSGKWTQAGEALSAFLNQNPQNVAALKLLAYTQLDAQNWTAARDLFERLRQRLGHGDPLLLAALAQSYLELDRADMAELVARKAYQIQPSSPVVSHVYGLTLLEQDKAPRDAYALLRKAVQITPGNAAFQKALKRAQAKNIIKGIEKRAL